MEQEIGKQMTGQPFGASALLAPLASLALRAPAGCLLQRLSFGGAGVRRWKTKSQAKMREIILAARLLG
ncbi:MAG: hypothetical protein HGA93_06795 [Methanothrix sp.]|nr:hypothetical protein [Methanothrix sp.]